MLCLISCAYQDGLALHIPYYLLPETEAPMLAALTQPTERSCLLHKSNYKEKGRELIAVYETGMNWLLNKGKYIISPIRQVIP